MKTGTLFGLLMLLATACNSKDDTMIVVEVWSDLWAIDSVRIDVIGPTASNSKTFPISGPNPWPVQLALVPQDTKDASLMVKATGVFAESEIVRQSARVAFVPGESKLLKLVLDSQCANAGCSLTQSCSAGICSPMPTIPNLPDYNPKGTLPATGGMGGAPTVAGSSGHSGGTMIGQGGTIVPFGGTVRTGGISSTSIIGGSITSGGSKSTGGISSTSIIGGVVTSGGSKSTGGSSGGTCAVGKACGGDVVGTWEVSSSCLNYSGYADISYLGLTCIPNTALITGSVAVTGTLTLNANGKYTDNTVTKGSESWVLDRSCLILSGTKVSCSAIGTVFSGSLSNFGYEDFQCMDAPSGGCNCTGIINQPGGLGLLSNDMSPTGSYKVTGNTLSMGDLSRYSYCVNGTRMTMAPNPDTTYGATPYTGTVVLQKSCSGTVCTGGTGGTSSTGGSSGGSVSTGGSKSSGGSTSSGGSKSSGGSTSSSGASCPSVVACGGDVVGTWNVASSCLKLDGDFATRGTGLGCDKAKVTGSLQVKGSFTASADKKFVDRTATAGPVTVTLDHQCLFMSGTWTQCELISVAVEGLGFRNVRCTDAASGGCTCPGTIDSQGNMGLIVADPQETGVYTISNNTLATGENALTGAALEYSYCVTGDKLTVTPKTTSPPTTGTIVLQRAAGGAGGSAGTK